MSDFGELRSLLQQPPSQSTFHKLTQQLDAWPEEALAETVVPYALDLLGPAWREAPWFKPPTRWKRSLQHQKPSASLRLFPRLDLRHMNVSIPWLASQEGLSHLEELDLSHTHCSEPALEALGQATFAPRLRSLQLHSISPSSLRPLWRPGAWPSLRSLGLRHNELTFASLAMYSADLDLPALEVLKLSSNHLRAEDLPQLFGTSPPPRLRSIDLEYNHLDAHGYRALTSSPWWPQIRRLSIGLGSVDGSLEALYDFLSDEALSELEHLILCDHHIDNTCLSLLATCPHFAKLQHLGCGSIPEGYARSMSRFDRTGVDALLASHVLQESIKQAWRLPLEERLTLP